MRARARHAAVLGTACLLALASAACSLALNGMGEVSSYDFGPAPQVAGGSPRLAQPVLVYDVTGPAWMESQSVFYRLAYLDAARPQPYANSRWVMPPAALLSARLRQRLAAAGGFVVHPGDGLRAPVALRVELDEFTQVFDAESRSRAVVRLRASLAGPRALIAQKSFNVERTAATPNGEGGVRALSAASDAALDQLLEWVAASIKN